ncbi:MAG: serine hydrolase domain-containing protein [Caulobacteraceae bacterium]
MPRSKLDIGDLLAQAQLPGAAYALVKGGKIRSVGHCGTADQASGGAVNAGTIFQAASLSKPLFAYLALQLVDAGVLPLDRPLVDRIGDLLPKDDARARLITARHVLSHTTGLPNWRSPDRPLRCYFEPGSRFSYSGEGYVLLQVWLERETGKGLDALAKVLVFEPLNLRHSAFDRRSLQGEFAAPHDDNGRPFATPLPPAPNSAASLHTTAGDYATFLCAALTASRLAESTARAWMQPNAAATARMWDSLDPQKSGPINAAIAWGLGWGLDRTSASCFHWGDTPGFKGLVLGSLISQGGLVVLTNGDAGSSVAAKLATTFFDEPTRILSWLEWATPG